MTPGALVFVHSCLSLGYRVWAEYHPYFADHSRGGWIEWLCR